MFVLLVPSRGSLLAVALRVQLLYDIPKKKSPAHAQRAGKRCGSSRCACFLFLFVCCFDHGVVVMLRNSSRKHESTRRYTPGEAALRGHFLAKQKGAAAHRTGLENGVVPAPVYVCFVIIFRSPVVAGAAEYLAYLSTRKSVDAPKEEAAVQRTARTAATPCLGSPLPALAARRPHRVSGRLFQHWRHDALFCAAMGLSLSMLVER